MLAIADYADDKGAAWPSVETLAKKIRMSERACRYLLPKIAATGELAIERNAGPKGCNLFRVQVLQAANLSGVQSNVVGGAKSGGSGGATAIAPEPSVNRQEPSFSLQPSVAVQTVKRSKKVDVCPYDEIIALYHRHCPSAVGVSKLTDQRKKLILARWNEIVAGDYRSPGSKPVPRDREGALHFLGNYFALIEKIDWCTGRKLMSDGRTYRVKADKVFAADFMAERSDEAHDQREAA